MKKVIKHGKTLETIVCDNCSCEYEYSFTDVQKGVEEYWVVCPECGVNNLIWEE